MAYTRTTWVDEVLAAAERFNVLDNVGAAVDAFADFTNCQIVLATTVTTPGTSLDAANLNKIENGIYDLSRGAALSVKGIAGNAVGDVADIVASADGQVLRRSGTTLAFGTIPNTSLVDRFELVYLKVFWHDESVLTGDGKVYFTVPQYLNGGSIVEVGASVIGASSSGLPTIQIHNLGPNPSTAGSDILSTRITIDVGEYTSITAATPPVISAPTLAQGDFLRIDVDVQGTGTLGLDVWLKVQKP